MSSSETPIRPDRIEALLRGEGGEDAGERRVAALLDELALGAVVAPPALRERVRIAAVEHAPSVRRRRALRLPGTRWTRLAVGLAGLTAVAGAAIVLQGTDPNSTTVEARTSQFATAPDRSIEGTTPPEAGALGLADRGKTTPGVWTTAKDAAPGPQTGRAQDYQASMTVAVGDGAALSRRTAEVIRVTRALGGAIASTDFQLPAGSTGHASIELRVPIARTQDAVARFSALGRITGQRIAIADLQPAVTRDSNRVRALRRKIALVQAKLLDPALSATDRAQLEIALTDARGGLESVLRSLRAVQARAAFSRFSLELVTGGGPITAAQPDGPFSRTLDRALSVLGRIARVGLYLAIVVGPFLLITLLCGLAYRRTRRRADRRLLEEA